jgi:hypothetical protein
MTTEISSEQNRAVEFLSKYFDTIVVSHPNKHNNVVLTALWSNDVEAMKWMLKPDGNLIYSGEKDSGPTRDATDEYIRRFREGTL